MDHRQSTKEQCEEAKKLVNFYTDLIENNSSTATYYLAENVVLDWFGKSIKDKKKVCSFMNEQVCKVTHELTSSLPVDSVAFKDCHDVKVSIKKNVAISSPCSNGDIIETTPVRSIQIQPSTSNVEMGQGDGLHNCPLLSPSKKIKLSTRDEHTEETVEGETESMRLKYITAEGTVEFRKPSSKKLQIETKWKRPVKLHLGYTSSSFKDFSIYLIIYEGNLKCRRNLMKEFCDST